MDIKTAFLVIVVVIVLQISLIVLPHKFTSIVQIHSQEELTVEWKEQVIDDIFSDNEADNTWSDKEQVTLNAVTMPTTSPTTPHTSVQITYVTEKTSTQPTTAVEQISRETQHVTTREYVVTDKPPQHDTVDGLEPVLEILMETDEKIKSEFQEEQDNAVEEDMKSDEPRESERMETADMDTSLQSDTLSSVREDQQSVIVAQPLDVKPEPNHQNDLTKDTPEVSISRVSVEVSSRGEKLVDADNKVSPAVDNSESQSSPDSEISAKPKMVLILTESRHGSTWTMDLLSWPEATVPIFEPLLSPFLNMYSIDAAVRAQALEDGHDPDVFGDWRAVTLARICLCDFNGAKTKEKLGGKKYGSIRGLGYKSRRLGTELKDEVAKSVAICDNENTLIVPKTIRLYDIMELSVLPEFGCDNFKVIHLVRDPRAVLLSRMKVFHELYDGTKNLGEHVTGDQENFPEEYMRRAARDLCSHHLHNYQVGHVTTPTWLRNRYKLVRYEDLATQPDKWAANLLHFVGVRYTAEYREYVYNTTHVKERGVKDRGYYAVERETSELLDSWRGKLLESHWRVIEQECAEMMRTMGYKMEFGESV